MEIKTGKATYRLIPQLGLLINSELEEEFSHLLSDKLDEEKIIENLRREISDEEIEKRVASISNITFNILEDCNYRCSYCIYPGNYELVRIHNPKRMCFETAQKMIEHLIVWITNKKRKTKSNSINIGFYGGEPLMELSLVKKIIEYSRKRFKEKGIDDKFVLGFRLNTDGYLLNHSIVDYLVKQDITVDVSLDGPAEEHDKFRLHISGNKTWDIIWNNLVQIRERYPDFYKNKINFLCTLHPFHDYQKIDRFFIDKPDYFDLERVNITFVKMHLLKEEIKKELLEKSKNKISYLSSIKSSLTLDTKLRLKKLGWDTHFTSMCFPGEAKLFVSANGTLHICERVKQELIIGDADNGIDFNAVRNIYRLWNDEIIRNRCWECPAWSFCSMCISQSEDRHGGVMIDCILKEKEQVKQILSNYLTFKEEEQMKENLERNVEKVSVADYLKKL